MFQKQFLFQNNVVCDISIAIRFHNKYETTPKCLLMDNISGHIMRVESSFYGHNISENGLGGELYRYRTFSHNVFTLSIEQQPNVSYAYMIQGTSVVDLNHNDTNTWHVCVNDGKDINIKFKPIKTGTISIDIMILDGVYNRQTSENIAIGIVKNVLWPHTDITSEYIDQLYAVWYNSKTGEQGSSTARYVKDPNNLTDKIQFDNPIRINNDWNFGKNYVMYNLPENSSAHKCSIAVFVRDLPSLQQFLTGDVFIGEAITGVVLHNYVLHSDHLNVKAEREPGYCISYTLVPNERRYVCLYIDPKISILTHTVDMVGDNFNIFYDIPYTWIIDGNYCCDVLATNSAPGQITTDENEMLSTFSFDSEIPDGCKVQFSSNSTVKVMPDNKEKFFLRGENYISFAYDPKITTPLNPKRFDVISEHHETIPTTATFDVTNID